MDANQVTAKEAQPLRRWSTPLRAYVAPFLTFMVLLALSGIIKHINDERGPFWLSDPEYWVYALQTLVCAGLVLYLWPYYHFNRVRGWFFTLGIALLVFVIWVAPQLLFQAEPRLEGFDPTVFKDNPSLYWANLITRFGRLVIVVPFVEEIFWRGFLLRYLINEDFMKIPFGKFSWFSFFAVTLCFGLAHEGPDFWVAIVTGILYNGIAYRTKSLGSCVLAHAVTNLLLGLYIMKTGQWGFW